MSSLLDDLLPGIPDDVTLNHITTKLPWATCQALSRVSLSFKQAIESREVYGARVRRHTTETLIVIKHQDPERGTAISLYSMREKAFYRLPPIPHLEGRILSMSQFISVDGKLYFLVEGDTSSDQQNIYVLDLAGRRWWEEFASFPGCIQGEIREPTANTHDVGCSVQLGENFYIRGGRADRFKSAWHVYDLVNDVYRAVSPSQFLALDRNPAGVVWGQGQLYGVRPGNIDLWNARTSSWTIQHKRISCDTLGHRDSAITIVPLFVLPVCNELVAIVSWNVNFKIRRWSEGQQFVDRYCLLQSRGLGSASKDIVWEKGPDCFHFDEFSSLAICLIEL